MSTLLKLICSILMGTLLLCLIATSSASPIDSKKAELASSTSAPTTQSTLQECAEGGVCGWAQYNRDNRKKIENYLKNTCQCSSNMKCLYKNDDLSLGAYVYVCRIVEEKDENAVKERKV